MSQKTWTAIQGWKNMRAFEELQEITDGEKLPIDCKVAMQNKEDKPA